MKKQAPSNILFFLTALACSTLSASAFYVIQPVRLTATTHSSKLPPRFLSDSSTPDNDTSLRTKLRNLTGVSLTAVRATLRATTGISMTALYTAAYLATSDVVRNIMAFVLQVLPTWARYFVQPFLILYYVPLFVIRTWSDRNAYAVKEEHHRALISNWKGAIETAGKIAGEGYWPVKVNGKNRNLALIQYELYVCMLFLLTSNNNSFIHSCMHACMHASNNNNLKTDNRGWHYRICSTAGSDHAYHGLKFGYCRVYRCHHAGQG
jgi:hypothetical protein